MGKRTDTGTYRLKAPGSKSFGSKCLGITKRFKAGSLCRKGIVACNDHAHLLYVQGLQRRAWATPRSPNASARTSGGCV